MLNSKTRAQYPGERCEKQEKRRRIGYPMHTKQP